MRVLRLALARCRALIRRDVVAGEIRDEMQFHLQMRAEEYERQGLRADVARRAADRRFGNLAVMRLFFPDGSAIGGFLETMREPPRRVIGVVGNIRQVSGPKRGDKADRGSRS